VELSSNCHEFQKVPHEIPRALETALKGSTLPKQDVTRREALKTGVLAAGAMLASAGTASSGLHSKSKFLILQSSTTRQLPGFLFALPP